MKKIVVKLSNERLITPSGLTLVGSALGKSDLVKRANRMSVDRKRSQSQIKNGDILLTYIGLLCQGKTSFKSVREFHADPDYYKAALGISYAIPSAETLRQRMDTIGRTLRNDILQGRQISPCLRRSVWSPLLLKTGTCLSISMLHPSITPKPSRKACPEPTRAIMDMLP